MNYNTLNIKNEILQWLLELEDEDAIFEILEVKRSFEGKMMVSEPLVEYAVEDDFEELWKNGLTPKQFRKEMVEFIDSLNWQKY